MLFTRREEGRGREVIWKLPGGLLCLGECCWPQSQTFSGLVVCFRALESDMAMDGPTTGCIIGQQGGCLHSYRIFIQCVSVLNAQQQRRRNLIGKKVYDEFFPLAVVNKKQLRQIGSLDYKSNINPGK